MATIQDVIDSECVITICPHPNNKPMWYVLEIHTPTSLFYFAVNKEILQKLGKTINNNVEST